MLAADTVPDVLGGAGQLCDPRGVLSGCRLPPMAGEGAAAAPVALSSEARAFQTFSLPGQTPQTLSSGCGRLAILVCRACRRVARQRVNLPWSPAGERACGRA
ncbi:hypothetical protein NDU88_006158 [Pleurodeles waltl]|uniref:Uncharacterized protein n=1 Tax=Pleurodeles waltl TaxID=8319 RepID=A0AAV7TZG9_PLEWA|nr:hypothetical protein NDU88_006158 [Pleurodeles waltl]